jgi:heme/copper-type cytochrome/quinol oxidase subunit 4
VARDFKIQTTFSAVDRVSRVVGKIQSRLVRFTARASMALRKLDRIASRLARGLGGIMKRGAFLAAGAATGLFLAINKTASSMDELAKKTRAMDFPIEEFQEWRFVAEQSGVSSEVFDKSIQKLGKNVGDLKSGTGSLLTILKKNDRQLMRQVKSAGSTSEAFELIVGAIKNTEDPMKKASLATAAFGRAGMDMINMANLGADEIEKLRGEMRENGVVTAKQAEQAEKYNDMMNRVKLTVSGFMVEAITPLLPMLTEAANSIREWMVANKGLIRTKITEFVKKIPYYIEMIVKWAPRIAKYIGIFYGIVVAVKVLNATMWLLNKAALASATSIGKVGTQGAGAMGKATGAAGKLQGALALVGVAVAAWEIGTLIHDEIVDPIMKARHEASMLATEVGMDMSKDVSKRTSGQLKQDVERMNKHQKNIESDSIYDIPGMGSMREVQNVIMNKRRDKVMKEIKARDILSEYTPEESNAMGIDWTAPLVTESRSTEKSEIEITVKDKSGTAEVKGKKVGKGVNLVHTGAAI